MPNQPKTPIRGFRIPDDLYQRLTEAAQHHEVSRTELVINAIEQYLRTLGGDER